MKRLARYGAGLACMGLLGACQPAARTDTAAGPGETVEVTLMNAEGAAIGTARLAPADDGVRVSLAAAGLAPGPHGFHIHETGRCDAPDFESAGGHFAPAGNPHGFEVPAGPHAGDLRNIEVGADGQVRAEAVNERITLGAGANSLFDADGSAVVIHAQPDDYRSQPSGDAGARVACGVVTRV